jgi:hypothetical protein
MDKHMNIQYNKRYNVNGISLIIIFVYTIRAIINIRLI